MLNDDPIVLERARRATLHAALEQVRTAAAHLDACSELERDDPVRLDALRRFRWVARNLVHIMDGLERRYA